MLRITTIAMCLFVFLACGESPFDPEADMLIIAQELKEDQNHQFLKTLKPTSADYKALFKEQAVDKISAYSEDMWSRIDQVPDDSMKPMSESSIVKIILLNKEDLQKGVTNGLEPDYSQLANVLQDDVVLYGIQFIDEEGTEEKTRAAFFYVNDHWIIIPRVYQALK